MAGLLKSCGHDALHTLDLEGKNRTSDEQLCQLASDEKRVLVTKDSDFVDSFLVRGLPPQLLFVTTGKLSNEELLLLFRTYLPGIVESLESHSFVEIDRDGMTIRS